MERFEPPPTGLDNSIKEELFIQINLDKYAPFFPDFPYLTGKQLSDGAEADVYEVSNIKDGKVYAAKKRFNPGTDRKLRNNKAKLLEVYNRFLAEVEAMKTSNHKNVIIFKQALRDVEGDLYIVMDFCDGGDLYQWRKINVD